jgi:glycosyltransferase involved in cell wall biosynthesis
MEGADTSRSGATALKLSTTDSGGGKMKIAFVVHDYHRSGGHSRYVAELATRYCGEHEVHVFANRIVDDGTPGIHFHHVPAWRANALTTVLSFALPVTMQIGGAFDIVHCQGFCGILGNVFTGHMCNEAWHVALERLGGGATTREAIFNAITGLLEHAMYRYARNSEVIAVSQRVERDLVQYYHCPAPIHVIYHGTDVALFSPQTRERLRDVARTEYGVPAGQFLFLYVGNLRKGAQKCMQALARLKDGMLLCVAATEQEPYRRFAEQYGVADRVIFARHTSQVEKAYAAGDAFLLPSPYDPFALVVSEAMGCGLPVVVSREAGVSELIQPGVNGLLLDDVTDDEELARHMRSLYDDPLWAQALGRAARRTIEELTWDRVAEQTLEVYRAQLNKQRRKSP